MSEETKVESTEVASEETVTPVEETVETPVEAPAEEATPEVAA